MDHSDGGFALCATGPAQSVIGARLSTPCPAQKVGQFVSMSCRLFHRMHLEISANARLERPLARPSISLVAAVDRPPIRPVSAIANRSAARVFARAFRGINGRLPALASRCRAPSINSTLPCRPRWIAALSVSHGDRRMRGRHQLNAAPHAEVSTANSGSLGNWGRAVEPGGHRRAESTRHRSGRSRTTVLTNRCDVIRLWIAPVARRAAVMLRRQSFVK